MTVDCLLAFSVRKAFKSMSHGSGKVSFCSALKFIRDNDLAVGDDQVKDVFDAIDKQNGDLITLKEFTALNPSHTDENKDFVGAILNFKQCMVFRFVLHVYFVIIPRCPQSPYLCCNIFQF